MKRIFIIIANVLALTFVLLSICGCSCGNSETEEPSSTNGKNRKEQNHSSTIEETDSYLVLNGKTEYSVVFPKKSDTSNTTSAVDELIYFFKEATGVKLASKPDAELTSFDTSDKYISIGETSLLKQANIPSGRTGLGSSGYSINSVGNSVFITGGTFGELYGVYGFLNIYFGFEVYSGEEIYIETGVSEKKFLDINVKDAPDIENQICPYGASYDVANRMRLQFVGDVYAGNRGYVWHNILKGILPYELYGIDVNAEADPYGNAITQLMKDNIMGHEMYAEHPEWFYHPEWYVMEKEKGEDPNGNNEAIEPAQVNLTISKDGWTDEENATSQRLLYDVLLYEMKKALAKSNSHEMAFTMQDNGCRSEDAISEKNKEKYGTDAAEYIQCANYLAGEMKKVDPDFRLTIFAYYGVKDAPVKPDGNGGYEPIDESVILADNVDVMVCIRSNRNFGIEDEKVNSEALKLAKQWEPLAKNSKLNCWLYGLTYYSNYFLPSSALMSIANNYRYMYENNYKMIFDQAQYNENVPRDWGYLKMYLVSKLRWNVYLDVNELIEDFFVNYYKSAAVPMLEAFNMEQNRLTEVGMAMEDVTNITIGSDDVAKQMLKEDVWPDNFLQQLLGKFDEAFKAIETYKDSDPVLYKTLYDRINLETFSIRYLRIEIYGHIYGDLANEWFVSLGTDAKEMGLTRFGELESQPLFGTNGYFRDI